MESPDSNFSRGIKIGPHGRAGKAHPWLTPDQDSSGSRANTEIAEGQLSYKTIGCCLESDSSTARTPFTELRDDAGWTFLVIISLNSLLLELN